MNRVLKTFLLWLVIAALPIQGLAAAIKATCGPTHHNPSAVVMVPDHHHDDGHAAHEHHHGSTDTHVVADTSSSDLSVSANDSSGSYKSSYCSACAACCVGAVAPPSALNWPADHIRSEIVLVSPIPLVTGYIPDRLKRPPRLISA